MGSIHTGSSDLSIEDAAAGSVMGATVGVLIDRSGSGETTGGGRGAGAAGDGDTGVGETLGDGGGAGDGCGAGAETRPVSESGFGALSS